MLLLSVQFVDSGRTHILGPHGFCPTGRLVDHPDTLWFIFDLDTQATLVRLLFTTATHLVNQRIVGCLLLLWADHSAAFVTAAAAVPGLRIRELSLSAARRSFLSRLFVEESTDLTGRIPWRNLLRH